MFQTGAEVFLHRAHFLEVIKTVETPNQKVVSVEADLQSDTVCTILCALTILYVKVIGPYWWLVPAGTVTYLQLYPYVQSLRNFLHDCAKKPSLLRGDSTWLHDDDSFAPHIEKFQEKLQISCVKIKPEKSSDLLKEVCQSMLRSVEKQLADFLQDGQNSVKPSKEICLEPRLHKEATWHVNTISEIYTRAREGGRTLHSSLFFGTVT